MPYPYETSRFSRRGFTLVELLVVVAIIALLISILLPALQNARELASSVKCKSNMRGISLGIQMYADDHGSKAPPAYATFTGGLTWNGSTKSGAIVVPWWSDIFLGPYIGNEHIGSTAWSNAQQAPSTELCFCPSKHKDPVLHAPSNHRNTGIGYNTIPDNMFSRGATTVAYTAGFDAPSQTVLLAEVYKYGFDSFVRREFTVPSSGSIVYRHSETSNATFADGHVEQFQNMLTASSNGTISGFARE